MELSVTLENKQERRIERKKNRKLILFFICTISVVIEVNIAICELLSLTKPDTQFERIEELIEREKKKEALQIKMAKEREERIKKETEMEIGRQQARAKERQEAHRQAMLIKNQFLHLLDEVDFFGKLIQIEASGSYEDCRRVGSVTLNRVRTNYIDFRDVHTIREVFYQGTQYSDESKQRMEKGVEVEPEVMAVANGLLKGEIPCLEEKILFQSRKRNSWMDENIIDANLPNSEQYYAYPDDFEEKCIIQ